MSYDMTEPFDFSMIDDNEPVGSFQEPSREEYEEGDFDANEDVSDLDWLSERGSEEQDEEDNAEGGDDDEDRMATSITELAEKFDELPDDLEFKFGDTRVSKKDLAEVVAQREFVAKSNKEFEDLSNTLTEQRMQMESHFNMGMTEARIKYEHYTNLLKNADTLHASDVQKALRLQKEAAKRYGELEQHAAEARRIEEQRQQEIDVMRIRRTDAELRGKIPGYKGVQDTLAPLMGWAQEQGIPQEGLMKAMSPALVQALMDAKEYRERVSNKRAAISTAAAKVKTAPKSISSTRSAKNNGSKQTAAQRRSRYENAMRNGDMSTAFNFLED